MADPPALFFCFGPLQNCPGKQRGKGAAMTAAGDDEARLAAIVAKVQLCVATEVADIPVVFGWRRWLFRARRATPVRSIAIGTGEEMPARSQILAAGAVVLAGFALPAAAASPNDLQVTVKVSDAAERIVVTYRHAADSTHKCLPSLEIPPGPSPDSKFVNTPFTVDFDSTARPPASGFRLELPVVGQGNGHQTVFRVALTAGGLFWESDNTISAGSVETYEGGMTGTFHINGLRSAGSPATISIRGAWKCPPAQK
jgi:hypothetical protein